VQLLDDRFRISDRTEDRLLQDVEKGGIFGKSTEDIPPGLKPVVFLSATYGTTEVVP
jgi:hypothetical protein